jgi:hypothetical protein
MEKINEYGVVLKTFKMYLNLPNDDLSFSLSNSAQSYKKCKDSKVNKVNSTQMTLLGAVSSFKLSVR